MKKKYFFGIFICLILLCSGVFLLVTNSFDTFNKIEINDQTDAATVHLGVSVKAYGAKAGSLGAEFTIKLNVYEAGNNNIHKDWSTSSKTEGYFSASLNALAGMKKRTVSIAFASLTENYSAAFDNGLVDVEYISGGTFSNDENFLLFKKWIRLSQTVFVGSYKDSCEFGEKIIYWKIECPLNDNGGTGGSSKVQYGTHSGTMSSINIPTRVGYKFNGYYTSSTSGTQAIDANGKWVWSNSACYPTTLYAHWERTDCGININLKYPNGTEGYEKCGLFDITYHDGKSVSNLSNEERPNGSTLRLPIGKKWTIKNIRPAEGLKFDKIVCTQGLTYSNKGNGVYEFSIDKSKVNTDNDLEIDIYMQYLYKININFYKLDKTSENGGTFNLYKQPSGGSETLVGENITNEPGSPYLDNNGKFILKNIKASENGACVKLTSENVKLKVANGKGKIEITDDKIIYTANSTGAGSGNGFDNEILIYTSLNSLKATLNYQGKGTGSTTATAKYNTNGTKLNLPSSLTHTGYTFKGWSLTPNGTGEYNADTNWNNIKINNTTVSTPNTGEITFNLYAIWQANDYTVTLNDGEGAVSSLADMTWISGATFNETTYTYNANGITSTFNTATGDFKINGTPTSGFILLLNTGLSFNEGDQFKIEITRKSGSMLPYLNNGYFVFEVCDQNGDSFDKFGEERQYVDLYNLNSFNGSTFSVTMAITAKSAKIGTGLKVWYYAAGTPASQMFTNYTINLKITKVGSMQNVNKKVKATYDSPMRPVTVPSKFGYTFEGYYDGDKQYYNANGTSARNWDKDSTATLNAKWTAYNYTLTLYGNDDITSDKQTTKTITGSYASILTLPSKPFTRSGYIFKGWSTTETGEVKYLDGANYSSLITSDNISITLYAQWEDTWANHATTIGSNETITIDNEKYLIVDSAGDLAYLSKQSINGSLTGNYIQTVDIDLSEHTWLPIGSEHAFCGTYLGQGHKITGLKTSTARNAGGVYLQKYGGLFGKLGESSSGTASAHIIGVHIKDCKNIYGQYSGAIAGYSDNSKVKIEACILENIDISGNTTASFVGNSTAGTIQDCLIISSNVSTSNATTKGFYTGTMTVNSSYYMNSQTATKFYTTGASSDYSNWIEGVFQYPLPSMILWYPKK